MERAIDFGFCRETMLKVEARAVPGAWLAGRGAGRGTRACCGGRRAGVIDF